MKKYILIALLFAGIQAQAAFIYDLYDVSSNGYDRTPDGKVNDSDWWRVQRDWWDWYYTGKVHPDTDFDKSNSYTVADTSAVHANYKTYTPIPVLETSVTNVSHTLSGWTVNGKFNIAWRDTEPWEAGRTFIIEESTDSTFKAYGSNTYQTTGMLKTFYKSGGPATYYYRVRDKRYPQGWSDTVSYKHPTWSFVYYSKPTSEPTVTTNKPTPEPTPEPETGWVKLKAEWEYPFTQNYYTPPRPMLIITGSDNVALINQQYRVQESSDPYFRNVTWDGWLYSNTYIAGTTKIYMSRKYSNGVFYYRVKPKSPENTPWSNVSYIVRMTSVYDYDLLSYGRD